MYNKVSTELLKIAKSLLAQDDDVKSQRSKVRAIITAFASYLVDSENSIEYFNDIKRLSKMNVVNVNDSNTAMELEIELSGEMAVAVKRALMGVSYNRQVVLGAVDSFAMILSENAVSDGLAMLKVFANRPKIKEVMSPDEEYALIDVIDGLLYKSVLKVLRKF